MTRLVKEDDSTLNLVALRCSGALVYIAVGFRIKEVEVTSVNVTSTTDLPSDSDSGSGDDVKKAVVLHVV